MSAIHTNTDAELEALVDARCKNLRPEGCSQVFRDHVAKIITSELDRRNWVPASAELIRQCSTDGALSA